ncbi:MAG: SUMF1/EgtB/PvdO family nonheme iron enzyme [bacterium]
MGQGGNVWEWNESAFDGANNSASEGRAFRGGSWGNSGSGLRSSGRLNDGPSLENFGIGFRVASIPAPSIPEPSTYALLLMTGAGALWFARRRR